MRKNKYIKNLRKIGGLKLGFFVFGGFSTVFTKFVQSQLFFNIYRVFRCSVIFVFTNRALKSK